MSAGRTQAEAIALIVLILCLISLVFLLYTRPISAEYERVAETHLVLDSMSNYEDRISFYIDQTFKHSNAFYISGFFKMDNEAIRSFIAKVNKNGSFEWYTIFPRNYSWVDLGHP